MKKIRLLLLYSTFFTQIIFSQSVKLGLQLSSDSLSIKQLTIENSSEPINTNNFSLVSFVLNGKLCYSNKQEGIKNILQIHLSDYSLKPTGLSAIIHFTNISKDTIQLENVVPFEEGKDRVYITGKGKHGLSRTHLFIPGKEPVNVIVPDNAWDMGFSSFAIDGQTQLTALVRRNRQSIKNGSRTRFETKLYPGGSVEYTINAETVTGNWHNALSQIFQKRMLFDIENFDNSLYERKDLQWVKHAYVNHLIMNWDKFYYDAADKKFHINDFLQRGKKLYGGDEFISLWPTWPTLGLDPRNQFDLYRDLPGGTKALKQLATEARAKGTKLFISYNPWDESTRSENHFEGISKLIQATSADGMVLDTKGESSKELQAAANKIRPGVIMYSEGMAVPKDMPGIVSGRVHNALYYPPMLNLNKLIKPSFAIFRVAELYKEPIQREFATSFFNGYGTEINIMSPGQPDWVEEQYKYLGRTTSILRENTHNFVANGFTPLIETDADNIWVNEWTLPAKTIYTIYSVRPEGYKDLLFAVIPEQGYHFVDIWHHRLLIPKQINKLWKIEAETNSFHKKNMGSNNEGEVDCIAKLPILIQVSRDGDNIKIATPTTGDELRIWAGVPAYNKNPIRLKPGKHNFSIYEKFGCYEGDIIIQLMENGILMDENLVTITPGESRRISFVEKTKKTRTALPGMVTIPAGSFHFNATHGDAFISYPKQDLDSTFAMTTFYMDTFPITNQQYFQFIKATHYHPIDTVNFLSHWKNGKFVSGQENFPVVYISYEDAKAYAVWAGKRLPTEIEWQYAAQTSAANEWPWKQTTLVTRKEELITETLTVTSLEGIDSNLCNLGNGKLYAVGKYPLGANEYGLQDLTGCVWQLTNDLYMSGSYRYIMMKGGSYFKPSSSWWYVQGGPRELHYRQFLLRVSQGFERNATVGFRCVKDVD